MEALRIIECLKKSGLEIKDIKQFFIWVSEGSSSYEKRKELFETRKSAVETEIQELQKTLSLLKFKCWYYETAMKDGNEDAINAMLPDKLPKICRNYMIKGMTDFCFLHQTWSYKSIKKIFEIPFFWSLYFWTLDNGILNDLPVFGNLLFDISS